MSDAEALLVNRMIQNKKPPRHGPKGGKQKHTHTIDVGNDYGPQCDEVHVITIDVHPYHSVQLGWKPRDDHVRPSALLPQVTQNAHSAPIVPPISKPYPALIDPKHINITALNIDALTKAWATVTIPAEIGPNHCGSLWCKVNTGASGNVMPLCVFAKLFFRCVTTDGKPARLHPCDTRMTAYNVSNILQFWSLDTAIEWILKGHQCSKHLQIRWYVADSPGPAILGLPSSSKLGIVQLNCAVKLTHRHDSTSPPKKPTTECTKSRNDHSSLLNSSKDLIKAYPDWFGGIGWFPGTCHITLHDDAKPVVHATRNCPVAMWPLVHEKLDMFIDQGIIVPVEEPTDWIFHLPTFGRQMGNYKSIWTQRICIQWLDMITTKPLQWKRSLMNWLDTCFTKLDGTSSYLCIVLDYESLLLRTFNTPWGRFRFVYLPWGLACAKTSSNGWWTRSSPTVVEW